MKNKKSKIKIVKDFVKLVNKDYRVRYSNQCECDIESEIVYINFKMDNEVEKIFEEFLINTFGKSYDRTLISILHEIGHIETYDEDRDDEREKRYAFLQILWNNTEIDKKQLHFSYYNLPNEIEATVWAVNFIENNQQLCQDFVKALNK